MANPQLKEKVLKEYDESIVDHKINGFFREHRYLSNFEPVRILYRGVEFPTTEHAYQAMKVDNVHWWHYLVTEAKDDAMLAKKIGGSCIMRPDWEKIKVQIMYEVNLIKYQDARLRQLLIQTGKAELIEANWWHDSFWGVYNGRGENNLGKVLMRIRSEIQYTADVAIKMS